MYKGRICYYGVVYDNVQLRFDEFKQQVVVLSPMGSVFCLPEQKYIDWFEMDGHRYVHDPEDSTRYAAILCDGSTNGVRLYHTVWKVYGGEKLVENTFLKLLTTNEYYTLITPDGMSHHVKTVSDVARLFPEQKSQITQFAKQNNLSFGKDEREDGLKRIAKSIIGVPSPYSYQRGKDMVNSVSSRVEDNIVVNASKSQEKISMSPLPGDTSEITLISGIPVLDSVVVAIPVESSKTKTYVVPGVKKARASVADDQELAEIVVVGGRQSTVKSTMMGSEKFKPQLLKNIPSAFGESDIMKIALTLPGVTTVGEASSGINVRGGATDQNLILFNGGTVYNPSHLFGLFTSFNSDMVEDVELFKASVPAQYGGRISSVMTVTSKEANM